AALRYAWPRARDCPGSRALDRAGADAARVSPVRYAVVLLAFGAQLGLELLYSARNERLIRSRQPSAPQASERVFRGIALVNLGLLTLPLLERVLRRRSPPALIAGIGWIAALTAVALRLSVI